MEKKDKALQSGSSSQWSFYDALELTLSQDLSAYALLYGKPETLDPLNPKP